MLTITTEKQVIYINIDLLKSRLKKAILTVFKALTIACGLWGVLLIIGAAGASDLDLLSLNQIIMRILYGFILCGIAYILNFIKNALQ